MLDLASLKIQHPMEAAAEATNAPGRKDKQRTWLCELVAMPGHAIAADPTAA